jgi:predicted aconitase with swiveling domain
MKIKGRSISRGIAEGPVLLSEDPISFLGNVNPETGEVVDPDHVLYGRSVAGTVFVFPYGCGSTVGSYVIYQLSKNGVAPAAMVNLDSEPIVAVGAIISGIPLIDRPEKDPYTILKDGDRITVDGTGGFIEL